ncbi:MAG: sigma-70 family RNA polymerase sigma factor [Bacteroidetes bacterium]|nr:sigma-70 family RNA polymerase sigma factor [Bacteroidota bacterium]
MADLLPDIELIRSYKKTGDIGIIGQLYKRYTALVYGVCLKYLKDRDEAKDATMQVFEKLIGLLKSHQVENFKSWLYVTTRNHCLMSIRSKKGKFMEEISDRLVETTYVLHLQEEHGLEQDLTKLENCINKLAEGQQQCVRLFYLDEKCYKDIVAMTGFDMNNVKSFIQNGKRNLKICMETNG